MSNGPVAGGVVEVEVGGALALFADRTVVAPDASAEALAESARDTASRRAGRSLPALFALQEHTSLSFVYAAEEKLAPRARLVGRCDALVTAEEGVVLTVRTADCLPVVLAGAGVAAIVHAGWRGLAADIVGTVVRRIAVELGVAPEDLEAVVGVGVGPCHYAVGPEVVAALSRLPSSAPAWHAGGRVDLASWAVGRLIAVGVDGGSIRTLAGCTSCSARHHSYRRDGPSAGRQWSAVVRLET